MKIFKKKVKNPVKPTPKMRVEQTSKKFVKPKTHTKNLMKVNGFILMSTILIMIGLFCVSYNYILTKRELAYDEINMQLRPDKQEEKEEEPKQEEEKKEEPKVLSDINYDYIGYLQIPAINLNKGFLDKKSPYNNVDKNLFVLKESDYPDVKNGNLIIAGHSGTGYKAFFKDLHNLNIGDIAKVTYKGYIYTYKIVNIEEQPKTGTITINRNYDKRVLTLITCTYANDTAQTIYLLENTKVEKEA